MGLGPRYRGRDGAEAVAGGRRAAEDTGVGGRERRGDTVISGVRETVVRLSLYPGFEVRVPSNRAVLEKAWTS